MEEEVNIEGGKKVRTRRKEGRKEGRNYSTPDHAQLAEYLLVMIP